MQPEDTIINPTERILVTGANGFIGTRIVDMLLQYGFTNLCCFARPSGNLSALDQIIRSGNESRIDLVKGNLLSREDCAKAAEGAAVIYHLAAGIDKSYAGAYLNTVVTTRNLLDAAISGGCLRRFVNVSSFAVYSGMNIGHGKVLDETCEVESRPEARGDSYCYAKAKQDELLLEYSRKHNIPYVIVRPGAVYGPGKNAITGRVGIGTFGIFLHMGGGNVIPFSYVDNCAEAIVLAGLRKSVDGEVFNIVDDNLPTSREFLKMYKKNVGHFRSIFVPRIASYLASLLWEKYSTWSEGQLPPVFNRSRWASVWKGHRYSNRKIKERLGWSPRFRFEEAMQRYFDYIKECESRS